MDRSISYELRFDDGSRYANGIVITEDASDSKKQALIAALAGSMQRTIQDKLGLEIYFGNNDFLNLK